MNKDKDDQSSWDVCEGGSASAGKSFDPADRAKGRPPADRSKTKEVPIGRPVSPKQYEKLKEQAGKDKLPSGEGAQEDPSARRRD